MTVHQKIETAGAQRTSYAFSDRLVMLSDPTGRSAEYVRALRTHVMAQHVEAGRRALAICEPAPRLGATFVAANLAVALAQAGVKTLLIDGNLRSPTLQHVITPARELPGLSECLSTAAITPGDYVQADVLPNLSIMFASGPVQNAQELLARASFEQMINACLRDFTMTIVDTPPANSCADALRLASVAGYSLIVSRRNKGLVSDAKVLARQLRANHSTVLGAVMNDG
jgi:capsular exopolysaccharide synthesis family protein